MLWFRVVINTVVPCIVIKILSMYYYCIVVLSSIIVVVKNTCEMINYMEFNRFDYYIPTIGKTKLCNYNKFYEYYLCFFFFYYYNLIPPIKHTNTTLIP